jgi:hypothetical protein
MNELFATYNITTKSEDFLRFVGGISEYTSFSIEYETKINVLDNIFLREFEVYSKNRLKDGGYITRLKFDKGPGEHRIQIYTNFSTSEMMDILGNASMCYIIDSIEIHLSEYHLESDYVIVENIENKFNTEL